MRNLPKLAILLCLIVPLNARGQKRVFLSSVGHGWYLPGGNPDDGLFSVGVRFAFTNPERKVGPHLWLVHHFSAGTLAGYDIGLASMGKRYYVGISAGPILVTPVVRGMDYPIVEFGEHGWALTGGVTVGAYYLPVPVVGLGFTAQGHLEGIAVSWNVFIRVGWKRP